MLRLIYYYCTISGFFLEEIEFSTERERGYEKNVEDAPEEWYYIVSGEMNQRVQYSEVNYDIQHTSVGD
jgi:oxalate decarboxylase/phosphoglucose isomerase-like protein (cupin superfamily)